MPSIGLDLGSVYVKAVCLDADGQVLCSLYRHRDAEDLTALLAFLDGIPDSKDVRFRLGLSNAEEPRPLKGRAGWTNGLIALAAGIRHLHPEARSILEVGGQTAKFLVLGADGRLLDFATNEACAAGTGSFLEQQARRLGLSVPELSRMALEAPRAATIAGRCSVFANSDMIHLQQKGTPLPEIAYGLCTAIARNFMTTLLKARGLVPPVLLAGGCAHNAGIGRAFSEVLGLEPATPLQISSHPGLEGAIGAARWAQTTTLPDLSLDQIGDLIREMLAESRPNRTTLAPLRPPTRGPAPEEPTGGSTLPAEGYLGLDVGSVSTDLVILDGDGNLLASVYLPTCGRPVDVLREGLAALGARFAGAFRVLGCGATGSGRHLAAKLAGADVAKNEITCQMLGAQRYAQDVDTILEIGGQDSKFIRLRNGALADFAMNKVCAAGTGSFLEEQSLALGVEIKDDFAARAFAAGPPPDLGSRCTVFMETEVVGARAGGVSVGEICAGLAHAIVRNYLDKVVGNRSIGERVMFQGGVASNGAVVAAFEEALQRPVQVHPFNRISGAIGAALAARTAMAPGDRPSRFKGFQQAQAPRLRSFSCHHCSNRCDVNVIESGGERAFFGDTCERYTSGATSNACRVPNLSEEYLSECEALFASRVGQDRLIGIPRASSLMGALPFWALFWKQLGFAPVLSASSSQDTLSMGLNHLAVGVCLPIKLTAGHVHALLGRGIEPVFLPSMVLLQGEDPSQAYACPYTMAAPYMLGLQGEAKGLTPAIHFTDEAAFSAGFEPFLDRLQVSKEEVAQAYRAAIWGQNALDDLFRRRVQALIQEGGYRHVFGILGRPYALFDTYLNLGLFERLRRMDVLAVPLPFLPLESVAPESSLPWRHPTDILRTAAALAKEDAIEPVILSSFACGPDAFALGPITAALRNRPHLVLELDEHRGEAGLMTRLEAFLDQLEGHGRRTALAPANPLPSTALLPAAPAHVRIPYFADGAYAFSGLFKLMGHEARVLPPANGAVRALGEKHSLGKECHAYTMIAGDLLQLAAEAPRTKTTFYFPGTALPCLLHEYGAAMQALLGELGVEDIRVSSPDGEHLVAGAGLAAIERFYVGLLAIEILGKAVCQVRPYEQVPGSTDQVHQQNLERMEAAIAGGDLLEALKRSLDLLALVPRTQEGPRPLVGVAGDIYTRVNPVANQRLAHWLEAQGLQVWPSPFQIDLLDFGISRRLHQSLSALDLPGIVVHGPVALRRALHQWRVKQVAGPRVPRFGEPDYEDIKRLATPYMPNEAHELLFLNIAKIVDFAEGGVDGIINAICFGCMVGNASSAVIERIRRNYDDLPILTAVYAGGEDPSRRMALEAFVSQVKARHRRVELAAIPT
ncbi:2-hydroxyglutaryl-CoA dehydratase activator [Geothrix limicola]|uniref:2-hydroxyglutaryl-CoA dehydratase activator n=1 Tax=Geothrix limicola TaxID=2927978 RepID=A0ABQ5QCB2_9BACT|nr:acyl-CoA dehydratase activase [Geothrix limicola]GLH72287.1 2-hydroxyglutaryl-CoA dehydratase activator [Geothrix limicola]